MPEIIPALLVESKDEFEEKLSLVEGIARTAQVDILDGTLFPVTNWYDARSIGAIRTDVRFELHLMVENPLPIIQEWKECVPTLERAIVHAEMNRPVGAVVGEIKDKLELEAGVSINPETPLSAVDDTLHHADTLLVMGVHPGKSGQAFEGDYILEKIRHARRHYPDLSIGVDGGVRAELVERLIQAGADRICAASAIFSADEPAEALKDMQKRASTPSEKS